MSTNKFFYLFLFLMINAFMACTNEEKSAQKNNAMVVDISDYSIEEKKTEKENVREHLEEKATEKPAPKKVEIKKTIPKTELKKAPEPKKEIPAPKVEKPKPERKIIPIKKEEVKKKIKKEIPAPPKKKEIILEEKQPINNILWPDTMHDYGFIDMGDTIKHTFRFVNTGDTDIEILDVQVSCGCTFPSYPLAPIAPGRLAKIDITFNSHGRLGSQLAEISVLTDANPPMQKLLLKGVIR